MNAATTSLFSASQLAAAIGISKPAVLSELKSLAIGSRGHVLVRGHAAPAWAIADLPPPWQNEIERRRCATGSRETADVVSAPPVIWQSPVPLPEIADDEISKAVKLRRALARSIELRGNALMSVAEREATGLQDYQREFGYSITERTFRALLKRTVERDNFAENWNRLDIYLDGNPKRKSSPSSAAVVVAGDDFAELDAVLASFAVPAAPGKDERKLLWVSAFRLLERQAAETGDLKKARNRLLDRLWQSAPCLAKNRNALRVSFTGIYADWVQRNRPAALPQDGRTARRGLAVAPPIPPALVDLVTHQAAFRAGGRVSQAVREMSEVLAGESDPDLAILKEYLAADPAIAPLLQHGSANKSYVNRRLRNAVSADVRQLEPYRLGGRVLNSSRAALDRVHDHPTGYMLQCDDVTFPVYWYVPDGEGWFRLVRGQCLVFIDTRSLCILGFSLQPDNNYSSPVIHTLCTKVFAEWGVPRKLYFERGIWERSRLITGGSKAQKKQKGYAHMPLSWAETEVGLGRLGIEFVHAIRPRSKIVERVIGLVQDLMEGEPGYCGRAEREDLPESIKRQMEDVKYKRVHPSKNFYDGDQWQARLNTIFEKYNRTVQQGKILTGMSPLEAQEKLQSTDPAKMPLFFDASIRFFLSQYVVEKEAGRDGLSITIGKKSWTYRNAQLSRDKSKTVLGWFNPADPSVLVVTDMNSKHPYSVELAQAVAATEPDPAHFESELKRIEDYEYHAKTRYQVLKAKFGKTLQPIPANRAAVETGQQIRQQREIIDDRIKQETTRKQTVRRRAGELGLPAAIVNTGTDGERGTALMQQALRQHQKNKNTEPTP